MAAELSHGEVRELEVLLALALKPRVLLLDEPAAGLSPAERVDIQALLTALPPELTLIMIEHDIDLLRTVVDSAAVLHLGALVVQGPIREIQDDERVRELYLGRGAAARPAAGPEAPGRGWGRAVIEVRDLHTYRGINYVLQGVSLTIRDGACTVLLGRNGMGKTTLVRSIMGLIRPRSGGITLGTENLVGRAAVPDRAARRRADPAGRRISHHSPWRRTSRWAPAAARGPWTASMTCSAT